MGIKLRIRFSLASQIIAIVTFATLLGVNLETRVGMHSIFTENGWHYGEYHWDMGWPVTAYTFHTKDYWDAISVRIGNSHPLIAVKERLGFWRLFGIFIDGCAAVAGLVLTLCGSEWILKRRMNKKSFS